MVLFKMKKWIVEKINKKLGIIDLENKLVKLTEEFEEAKIKYNYAIKNERYKIEQVLSDLKTLTRVDADVGFRGNNTIILTGVFRGRAYVQFYDMNKGEFESLAKQLMHMKRYALIRHIDAPTSFRGSFGL